MQKIKRLALQLSLRNKNYISNVKRINNQIFASYEIFVG
jgi:hypothetical protein